MHVEIKGATVLLSGGCDFVTLQTDLPCPFVKDFMPSLPTLSLRFETTYDLGIEYCRRVFGLDPKVINVR